ncbi:bifunctional ornithine acetyltransferase/N-acetylglutamate synthase, partial [Rhizobium ruizarguesonis]
HGHAADLGAAGGNLRIGAAAEDGQVRIERADDPRLAAFRAALNEVLKDLSLQVVRDGEGATKMLEITVTGAESDAAAKR